MTAAVIAGPSSARLPIAAGIALLGGSMAAAVRPAAIGLGLAFAALGVARAGLEQPALGTGAVAAALAGQRASVEGTVVDDPRPVGTAFEVLLEPARLVLERGVAPPVGNLLVRLKTGPPPEVGDRVRVWGRLRLPVDRPGFDRRAYLAQRRVLLELQAVGQETEIAGPGWRSLPAAIRQAYREALARLLPPPHDAVLAGVVLGVRSGIPPRLQQDLVATGLVHLLVLSGLKVAVFARLATGALGPLLGRAAPYPVIGLLAVYALVGGATPAALRAAAMGILVVVASRLGRPTHVWTSLSAAAAGLLAWRPEMAWDVGFQLSFAGTAAIILLTPPIEARLGFLPHWLREPFAVTCAAQAGTVPMMGTDFHLLSAIGPLANALVLPLLPAMVAGGLLIAPAALLPELGRLAALPLAALLAYLEQIATWLARIPGAAIPVLEFPPWAGVAYYLALGGAVVAGHARGGGRRAALAASVLLPALVVAAELVAWTHEGPAAAVLPVGEGQAVLLHGPGGYVLIDGGPDPARLAGELGRRLPPWQRRLEGLVITGAGPGHSGGLAALPLRVERVLVPAGPWEGTVQRNAALGAVAGGARLEQVEAGRVVTLAGLRFEVLAPEPATAAPRQLALRIQGPSGRALCDLADLDREAQVLAASRLGGRLCETLLLPGGGHGAPAAELLAAARPRRLIASDGGGRPAREIPPGLLLRTSEEGLLTVPL